MKAIKQLVMMIQQSLGSLFRQGHDNIYCRFHDGATPISLKTRDPINKSWVSPFFLLSHGRKF